MSKDVIVNDIIEEFTEDGMIRKYRRLRFLGRGAYAKCFEMQSLISGTVWAAKVCPKSALSTDEAKAKLTNEITLHKTLSHVNIVQFGRFFEDSVNVHIILELCHNRTLSDLLKTRKHKRLSEAEVRYFAWQLLDAVEYLHSQLIVHRDLKLGNLFLSKDMQLKVGDFGLATRLEHANELKKSICGTPNYISPEILSKKGHSFSVDVWAIGVIMFALLTGQPPFEGETVKKTYRNIRALKYAWPDSTTQSTHEGKREKDMDNSLSISSAAKSLIARILVADPSARPTIAQIRSDAFFSACSVPGSLPASLASLCQQTQSQQSTPIDLTHGTTSEQKVKPSSTLWPIFAVPKPRAPTKSQTTTSNTMKDTAADRDGVSSKETKKGQPQTQAHSTTGSVDSKDNRKRKREHATSAQTQNKGNCKETANKDKDNNDNDNNKQRKKARPLESISEMDAEAKSTNANTNTKTTNADTIAMSVDTHAHTAMAVDIVVDVQHSTSNSQSQGCDLVFVVRWLDASDKFGLFYRLSNDDVGARFRDNDKALLAANGQDWLHVPDAPRLETKTAWYSLTAYPTNDALAKKLKLLLHARSQLQPLLGSSRDAQKENTQPVQSVAHPKPNANSVFVRRWTRSDDAVAFYLSNDSTQVVFQDDPCWTMVRPDGSVVGVKVKADGKFEVHALDQSPNELLSARLAKARQLFQFGRLAKS